MDLQSLVTWNGMPPDYILEGLWYLTIDNEYDVRSLSTIKVGSGQATSIDIEESTILGNFRRGKRKTYTLSGTDFLDPFIQEVNIPQLNLSYEKTDFDMINFEDKEQFGSITMTFCDDTQGTCLNFFNNWTDSIFDVENNCLRNNWRNECMRMTAHLIRIYKKAEDVIDSFARASIGGIIGVANGVASLVGESFGNRLQNIEVIDIASFEMRGCLPKGLQEISLDVNSGDRMTFSFEIECETVSGYYRADSKSSGHLMNYSDEHSSGYQMYYSS